MNPRIEYIALAASTLTLIGILELVRRRHLRESYALLWIGASLSLIALSLFRDLLEGIAWLLGIFYPPMVLLILTGVSGFFLAIHYSIVLSKLADQNRRLAQEVALLKETVREMREQQSGSETQTCREGPVDASTR